MTILCLAACCKGRYTLFDNGGSDYSIVVADDASESEKWAAEELQKYLAEAGGATLPIVSEAPAGPKIVIGHNAILEAALPDVPEQDYADESFTYRSEGADIYIYGGAHRGTMYGVFTFLERELGVRWYTDEFTLVPRRSRWSFDSLRDSEAPGIAVRETMFPYSYANDWEPHNKCNGRNVGGDGSLADVHGGRSGFWGCHTSVQFISPDEYYDEHPEYFSLVDGKRLRNGAQLCLSNPDVLKLAIEKMRAFMREHPDPLIYDFSQADVYNPCECDSCKALKARFGNQESGNWVWFINQIADAVRDEFPDKYVSTFAYEYGRTPPENIKPRDNVVIRLCSIECCFVHPISDPDCPENAKFYEDLKRWGELAPHLYIWDYTTDFRQYMGTLPNYYVFQDNIRAFRDNNAIGVMEQGAYQTRGAEFGALKNYLLSKILWDPDCDVQAVIDDFIDGYYGSASKYVHEWFDLCAGLARTGSHMTIYEDHDHSVYTDEYIDAGLKLYKKAVAHSRDGKDCLDRVECAFLPAMYLVSVKHPERGVEWLDTMKRIVKNSKIDVFSECGAYFNPAELFAMVEKEGNARLKPVVPPAMGWRSEAFSAGALTAGFIGAQADEMASAGLADAGYKCVSVGASVVGRGGLKDVAARIHSRGMKTGIFVDDWAKDLPALAGEWDFDCVGVQFSGTFQPFSSPQQYFYAIIDSVQAATGRPVSLSIDGRGFHGVWTKDVAESWNIAEDGVANDWESVKKVIGKDIYLSAYAGESHYNDLGLLAAGRKDSSLTPVEKETQFTMWCALASPLFLGCDLADLAPEELALVTNRELVAVSQDPLGLQSELIKSSEGAYALAKDLGVKYGTKRAVALYNPTENAKTITVTGSDICLGGQLSIRDLNLGRDLGKSQTIEVTLPAHGAKLLAVEGSSRLEKTFFEAECAYCSEHMENSDRGGNVVARDAASSGAVIDGIGYTISNVLNFNDVMIAEACTRTIAITLFPTDSGNIMIIVNGNRYVVPYPEADGNTPVEVTAEVEFRKGSNSIVLGYPAEPIPPVDCLILK